MVGDIIQPTHLLFILVVALLVLGPKRLPEVGRTLGSGLRDFRAAISGESTSHDDDEPRAYVETEPEDELQPETAPSPARAGSSATNATTPRPSPTRSHGPRRPASRPTTRSRTATPSPSSPAR